MFSLDGGCPIRLLIPVLTPTTGKGVDVEIASAVGVVVND